ncbi:STM3941 family protein [Brevundimonas sp.]|uniref:STM3941 family protein n=1 Tax=Brevundimonas sp. TaxID=1871086 RepID=UPI003D14478A
MERPQLVLTGVRWKSCLRALASLTIAAAGLWMLLSGAETARYPGVTVRIIGLLLILAFGFNAVLTTIRTVKPAKLILNEKGFRIEGVRSSQLIPWEDVQAFEQVSVGLARWPAFRLKPGISVRDQAFTRNIVSGYDGLIAVLPKCGLTRTVEILSEWRERYANGTVSSTA